MIKIKVENILSTIEGTRLPTSIENKFNVFVPGYKYTWEYKRHKWDGKQKFLTSNTFQTGLLPHVIEALNKERLTYEIEDNRKINSPEIESTNIELRDYQAGAVNKVLSNTLFGSWWPRGTIKLATGAGKSRTAAAIVDMIKVPTLFLTHKIDLVEQTKKAFLELGIKSGTVTSAKKDLSKRVTIGTVQTLMSFNKNYDKDKFFSRFIEDIENPKGYEIEEATDKWNDKSAKHNKDQKTIEKFLNKIEMIIIDEAHLLCANKDSAGLFLKALNMMPNAYVRLGLTATPSQEQFSILTAEGATGAVLCDIGNKELIEQGHLSKVQVDIHIIEKQGKIPGSWPDCYDLGIVTYKPRNQKIIDVAVSQSGATLILVTKVNHGNILVDMFTQNGLDIPFLFGEASIDERKKIASDLLSGRAKCVIASTIWDEGIDIPNIETVILAGAGKSTTKNLQRIGRGMRNSEGKSGLKVIDFYDKTSKVLLNHSNIRANLWKEQGFEVHYIR